MVADLAEALDALDLAVSRAAAVVGDAPVAPFARVASEARRRTGFLGETVVIALGGGTGVGKSSLLNAIAGEEVAVTGALRPTTDRPLAWVPSSPEPGLTRLLDSLGVEDRVGHEEHAHLAILDLPDFDSVIGRHRQTVEALLARVDAVIWVVDPEKYNDRTIHADYLRPLAGYQAQFVFVINQIDRLTRAELHAVLDDFSQSLERDGIRQPLVFTVAANPPGAGPAGLEPFLRYLDRRLDTKRLATGKLIEDLRRAGRGLTEVTGLTPGEGLDFDRKWQESSARAASVLAGMVAGAEVATAAEQAGERTARRVGGGPLGRFAALLRRSRPGRALGATREEEAIGSQSRRWEGRAGLERALTALGETITDLSFAAGGTFGRRLRERFGDQELRRQVRGAVEGTLSAVAEPPVRPARWLPAAAVVQGILGLTIAGCAVWAWARPGMLERGNWPWPLIGAGGAVLLSMALAGLVRRSGRRAGRQAARRYRDDVETALIDQLSRRIGLPVRSLLRERAVLEGALTELAVVVAKAEAARKTT